MITIVRQSCLVYCALILILPVAVYSQAEENFSEASKIVETLHNNLIEVMRNSESLGYQGRFDRLDPVISSNFDTPLIVKVILSRYWKTISDEQKNDFIELFNKLSIATYASRFDSYNGEEFKELAQKKLKKGRLIIETELIRVDDDPVKLNYLMHQKDGKWYIISVIANGVNDLSLKRAEYAAVIKDKGFSGLMEDIENKIKDMETEIES